MIVYYQLFSFVNSVVIWKGHLFFKAFKHILSLSLTIMSLSLMQHYQPWVCMCQLCQSGHTLCLWGLWRVIWYHWEGGSLLLLLGLLWGARAWVVLEGVSLHQSSVLVSSGLWGDSSLYLNVHSCACSGSYTHGKNIHQDSLVNMHVYKCILHLFAWFWIHVSAHFLKMKCMYTSTNGMQRIVGQVWSACASTLVELHFCCDPLYSLIFACSTLTGQPGGQNMQYAKGVHCVRHVRIIQKSRIQRNISYPDTKKWDTSVRVIICTNMAIFFKSCHYSIYMHVHLLISVGHNWRCYMYEFLSFSTWSLKLPWRLLQHKMNAGISIITNTTRTVAAITALIM